MGRNFPPPSRVGFTRQGLFLSLTLIAYHLLLLPAQGQELGRSKLQVNMDRKRPPEIYLAGTDITVRVVSQPQFSQFVTRDMEQRLTGRLLAADRRLQVVIASPATLLACEIAELRTSARVESRTRSVYQAIGQSTVYNPTTQTNDTVTDYGYVTQSYDVLAIEGSLVIRYECRDVPTGKTLDALTLNKGLRWDQEDLRYDSDAAAMYLWEYAASLIAARFGARLDPVTAPLPRGKLTAASKLLRDRLWGSAAGRLYAMPEFKQAADEAHRLYSLGVAYEGRAYYTTDLATARQYLEEASDYYARAADRHPVEPEIGRARRRVLGVLQDFKGIEGPMRAYQQKAVEQSHPGLAAAPTPGAGRPALLDNATILQWEKSGLSDKEILKRLRRVTAADFDLSARGEADLAAGGVSARVVDEMRFVATASRLPQQSGRGKWLTAFGYALAYASYYLPLIIR